MSRTQGHWCYYERRARVHRLLYRFARLVGAPCLAARFREPDHGMILDHGDDWRDLLIKPPDRSAFASPSRPDSFRSQRDPFLATAGRRVFRRGTGTRHPEAGIEADVESEPGR